MNTTYDVTISWRTKPVMPRFVDEHNLWCHNQLTNTTCYVTIIDEHNLRKELEKQFVYFTRWRHDKNFWRNNTWRRKCRCETNSAIAGYCVSFHQPWMRQSAASGETFAASAACANDVIKCGEKTLLHKLKERNQSCTQGSEISAEDFNQTRIYPSTGSRSVQKLQTDILQSVYPQQTNQNVAHKRFRSLKQLVRNAQPLQ